MTDDLESGILYIDSREKDEDILFEVRRVADERDVPIEERHLNSGDYVFQDEITAAIEYKGNNDAVKSAVSDDETIFKQCNKMADTYERAFLMIVGKTSQLDTLHGDMGYEQQYGQLKAALPELGAKMNIPGWWFRNENLFADIGIRMLINSARVSLDDAEKVIVSPGISKDPRMAVLQGINGIGPSQAKSLLEHFGTVVDVFTASYLDLKDIKGVGSTTAWKIYNTGMTSWDDKPGPGFDVKHTDNPAMYYAKELSSTQGGPFQWSMLRDILESTDELQDDPELYIRETYGDELSGDEIDKLMSPI